LVIFFVVVVVVKKNPIVPLTTVANAPHQLEDKRNEFSRKRIHTVNEPFWNDVILPIPARARAKYREIGPDVLGATACFFFSPRHASLHETSVFIFIARRFFLARARALRVEPAARGQNGT